MDAPLRCCLKELLVDWRDPKMSVYDALSYVWGATVGDRPLLCDGQTLLITLNCESALRHLREKEEQLVIWVDSVCINQEDTSEKNSQVAIMRFVYNRAQRVYIWLGQGGEDTAGMFRTINSLGRWRRLLPDSALRLLVPQLGSDRYREEFTKLAQHIWWERVWTLQEILVVGRNAKVIFVSGCGRCFVTKMRFVYRWYRRSAKSIEQHNDLEKMRLRFTTIQSFENCNFGDWGDPQRFPRSFQTHLWLEADEMFSQILITTWNHRASNPRDHIYAKLSVIEDLLRMDEDFIKIDYGESVARVFEEFTRRYMELLGTISLLYQVPRSMPRMDGLPSWVPDYSGTLERPDAFSSIQRIWDSALVHRPTIRTSGPGQLILKGEIVGTLGPVVPMNPIVPYARSDFTLAEVWDQYVREAAKYLKSLTPPGTAEDLVIVEKLCAPKGKRNCFKHRLFVTLQRHIGRARGDIREGDVAVDFLGGGDSSILRSRGKEYEFVGTAVIYGAKAPSARFRGNTPDGLDTFVLV